MNYYFYYLNISNNIKINLLKKFIEKKLFQFLKIYKILF